VVSRRRRTKRVSRKKKGKNLTKGEGADKKRLKRGPKKLPHPKGENEEVGKVEQRFIKMGKVDRLAKKNEPPWPQKAIMG